MITQDVGQLSWVVNRKTETPRLGCAEGDQSAGFLYDQQSLDSGSCALKFRQITGGSDRLGLCEEVGEKDHAIVF